MTSQLQDWKRVNELYCNWMYHEAVESGYDARAAEAAQRPYLKAFADYQERWGVLFDPAQEPMSAAGAALFECFRSPDPGKQLEALTALMKGGEA